MYAPLYSYPVFKRVEIFEFGLSATYLSRSLACSPSTENTATCLYGLVLKDAAEATDSVANAIVKN